MWRIEPEVAVVVAAHPEQDVGKRPALPVVEVGQRSEVAAGIEVDLIGPAGGARNEGEHPRLAEQTALACRLALDLIAVQAPSRFPGVPAGCAELGLGDRRDVGEGVDLAVRVAQRHAHLPPLFSKMKT